MSVKVEAESDDELDNRIECYPGGDDSELEDCELACPANNPHKKIANASRGKPFIVEEGGRIKLGEGNTFVNLETLRAVLTDFRVKEGFLLHFEHNDKKRLRTGVRFWVVLGELW